MRKRDETLRILARYPFLPAEDLALLAGTRDRAARAQLRRLAGAGLVECVRLPVTRMRMHYLTPAGVVAAAHGLEMSPATLATRYGLGERALLRRLPALDHLLAGRRVLFALGNALLVRDAVLEDVRAWPVPWLYTRAAQRRVLYLDGEGAIRLPGPRADRRLFGFIWDGDDTVPAAVLSERLAQLELLSASPAYTGPRAPRVPTVLVVTTATDRVPPGYRPGVLWTTRAEIGREGVLNAPWREIGPRGEALPLLALVDHLGVSTGRATIGEPLSRGGEPANRADEGDEGVCARPPRLQQRADALRVAADGTDSRTLLPLVIPPRGVEILEMAGAHPLLSATAIARACDLNAVDAHDMLGLLCRHDLVTAWMPPLVRRRRAQRRAVTPGRSRRVRRYVLTTLGLRFLAARVGLTPVVYRRIYGALDDRVEKDKKRGACVSRAGTWRTPTGSTRSTSRCWTRRVR